MKQKAEKILIKGDKGNIELRVKHAPHHAQNPKKQLAVISHPHPLYGGTMDNKVVTTLERTFLHLGYSTVAYNFRGVGQSDGEYDNGQGEQKDLQTVVRWAQTEYTYEKTVLAGFSFGSYVTLQAYRHCNVHALCTVAPPVGLYDFSGLYDIALPWVLIQGGQDEVVSPQEILDWAMGLETKPDLYWRDKASHFFHGELIWLRKVVEMAF
ncbi:Dot/Icm type IV secretion system effector CoxH3 [Thiomicrorhabdus hydrogeniphila]